MVSLNRPASPEPIDPPHLRPSSSRLVSGIVIQRPTPSSSPSPSLGLEPLPERRPPLSPIPYVARSPSPNLLPESDAPDSPSMDSEFLVRTAQASRLRRRGAIRIENRQRGDVGTPALPPPRRRQVELDEDYEDDEDERRLHRPTLPFMLTRSVVPADFSGERYRLYCGGVPKRSRTTASTRWMKEEPVWPSPFPSLDRKPSRKNSRLGPASTGCGELVCLSACASERIGVWLSDTPKQPMNVTRMDEDYVDHGPGNVIKTGKSNCGCDHEGIGCRNCGNSLGMRIHHCLRHSELHASLAQSTSRTSPPTKRRIAYVFNPLTVSHDPDVAIPFPFKLPEEIRPNSDLMSLPPELLRMAPEEIIPNFSRFSDNHPADNLTPTTPTPPTAGRRPRAPVADPSLPGLIPAVLNFEPSRLAQLIPPARPGWSIIRSPISITPPSPSDLPRIIAAVRSMPSSSGGGNGTSTPVEERRRSRNFGSWGPPSLDDASSTRLGSSLASQCPTPPIPLIPSPPGEGEGASSSSRQPIPSIPTILPSPELAPSTLAQPSGQAGDSHSESDATSVEAPPPVFSQPVVATLARLEAIRARLNALLEGPYHNWTFLARITSHSATCEIH
ncbi:hypothetical protein M407DRAFT_26153 [Tulasnella calospora MUT 4182]|uniref:Uncharacterized protein n=1 Tax=Tulasnella calospora MUT 4182 TaxID=1051891 RepID=A0A0C3KSL1_9AGAM|nr:hypothetical protein M407DRAFT_26153 [Tulasnella calospora MUT 4182]